MLLTPGARLGPYEIVAPLGAGGMGEVYKARDTRLDRTVAIKILPAGVADDPQRQERFRREARAISSLTHAHICTLHDIGEQDGVEFLVMEYLAGETLAHRLLRGALPLEDVLRIAVQLADALDAAHRAGLTHRDLKPANVMLTAGGAKVLDFGLAKWHGSHADVVGSVANATVHPTLTQTGIVVGTIQYMAPEQVEGREADSRSDLFSIGAIVYEMTTGRRAFEGTSSASVMAAILTSSPAPMATVQPVTPPALEHVVKNCLAKNPEERWQSAGDIARELNWISETSSHSAVHATLPAPPKRHAYAWIATTCVFAVMTASLAVERFRQPRTAASPVRLFLPPPEHTAYPVFNQIQSAPVVSPDGRYVAVVAHEIGGVNHVWVRSLDDLTARALPGTESAFGWRPFWSPDSRSLAFFANGKLERVDLAGGAPQVLGNAPDPRGGTWSKQNVIVFAPNPEGPLYRVSALGGPATPATKLRPAEAGHRFPVFLPDGQHFLYLSRDAPQSQNSGTYVGSLDSSEVRRLLTSQQTLFDVAYANTGHLLFVRGRTLFAQKFDLTRLAVQDEPITIADHVDADPGPGAMFSISTNGLLVYRQEAAEVISQLVWFDRAGKRVGQLGAPANQDMPTLSPDGTRVAVRRGLEPPGHDDIWILNVATGAESRFTFDSGNFNPVWSPDGRTVAFGSQRHEPAGLLNGVFRRMSSGVGDVETLVRGRLSTNPTDWSRDGKFVIYVDQDPTTQMDIWALPLTGDRRPIALVRTAGADTLGQLSPDGRWLAYASSASGRTEVYVQAFPVARGKWQISTSGGTQPRWRRDGRELFYLTAGGELMAVPVKPGIESIETGIPVPLFAMPPGFGEDFTYDAAADGRRFLVNTIVSDTSQPIVVVLNWTAALK
jgi:Tol biopolymer transport system component